MALTYLVDTSVLTRLARKEVREVVAPLLEQRQLARCSMSDLELGFSARNAREWDDIHRAAGFFELVETGQHDFEQARRVQRALAGLGFKGRKVPDLLIAAVAERAELTVLHYDRDFDLIAEATGQPARWVVERGSID
ncbi:PIN domain nuclease [Amycolatopsis sp. GM8]|uniref:PIN domain nuclease n=1 Tax=Amycolatopsis sp. GM8 TaxID=2896530 RepID=UPI001F360306|nr:PIN domain nuclease [Amycolatopsis sp. GM8]